MQINTQRIISVKVLTPDFVSIDLSIEIEVRFDKYLAHRVPLKLFVRKPDGLKQDAVGYDYDQQEHNEITHLNHLCRQQTCHNISCCCCSFNFINKASQILHQRVEKIIPPDSSLCTIVYNFQNSFTGIFRKKFERKKLSLKIPPLFRHAAPLLH